MKNNRYESFGLGLCTGMFLMIWRDVILTSLSTPTGIIIATSTAAVAFYLLRHKVA